MTTKVKLPRTEREQYGLAKMPHPLKYQRPRIRTRNDLLALIGASVKTFLPHMSDERALSTADHILRSMRTAGLRIRQSKHEELGGQSGVPWREVVANSRLPANGPNETFYGTNLGSVKLSGEPLWATCENALCDRRMKGIQLSTDEVIGMYGADAEVTQLPMICSACRRRLKVSLGSKPR